MIDLLHNYLADVGHWHTWAGHSLSHLHLSHLHIGSIDLSHGWMSTHDWTTTIMAQFKETDISGDVGKWWDKAVKTGQVWAFLLGIIFGYLFKTFTTYG